MIHLDTSFLIRSLISGTPEDESLRRWRNDGERFGVSSVAWSQFLCGPVSQDHADGIASLLEALLPFDVEHAVVATRLFNETGRRRGSLTDCMIAATAMQADVPLATSNPDFRRFESLGLRLVSPG